MASDRRVGYTGFDSPELSGTLAAGEGDNAVELKEPLD
jgi:hypothetical protein